MVDYNSYPIYAHITTILHATANCVTGEIQRQFSHSHSLSNSQINDNPAPTVTPVGCNLVKGSWKRIYNYCTANNWFQLQRCYYDEVEPIFGAPGFFIAMREAESQLSAASANLPSAFPCCCGRTDRDAQAFTKRLAAINGATAAVNAALNACDVKGTVRTTFEDAINEDMHVCCGANPAPPPGSTLNVCQQRLAYQDTPLDCSTFNTDCVRYSSIPSTKTWTYTPTPACCRAFGTVTVTGCCGTKLACAN